MSKNIGINPLLTHEPDIFFGLLGVVKPTVAYIRQQYPHVSATDAEKYLRWWHGKLAPDELEEARVEYQRQVDGEI